MTARDASNPPHTALHATCVVLGEAGILIRGEAGAGKSTLALLLLDRAIQAGIHAGLVGDDRIRIARHHGRVVASSHPAVAGVIEVRGLGLRRAAAVVPAAVVRLVVDLVAIRPRLPDDADGPVDLLGVALPRLMLDRTMIGAGLAPRLVLDALSATGSVAAQTHSRAVLNGAAPGM